MSAPPRGLVLTRRAALLSAAASLAGCGDRRGEPVPMAWVGAAHERGHRLRDAGAALPAASRQRRADVLIVGGGIAGLAAARALRRAGIEDFALLELEDQAGGNSRARSLNGLRCPLGAHYLPVPGEPAAEVREWLHEIGLLQLQSGVAVPDERYLCHSPQERLFFEGLWFDGLLPPAAPGSATLAQYRRFGALVDEAQRSLGFALPTQRAPWRDGHRAFDAETFEAWLNRQGLDDAKLRWYLDYACRDDYGAGMSTVSAWAGLHYFASRHGFHAPGDEAGERDAVFTWPEGNAWLAERLASGLGERLQPARVALRAEPLRQGWRVLALDATSDTRNAAGGIAEAWTARALVLATPLFIAARLLRDAAPPALAAVARAPHAPWLVANLALREPLLDRGIGAPLAWDNVAYGSASLGYVDAGHQRLNPMPGPTVLTAYWALPQAERARLLGAGADVWAARVLAELQPLHPDLAAKLERVELMRYGHAMSIPVPGLRGSPALASLASLAGPLQFAHADLSAYSVFEEAFTHGDRAGRAVAAWLHR